MDLDRMWARWYMLPEARRLELIRQYGGEFNAAWAFFKGKMVDGDTE